MANIIFPLFCLPEDAQKNTLRVMALLEIASFSLCSKKSKAMVILLQFKSDKIIFIVNRTIKILYWINMEYVKFNFFIVDDPLVEFRPLQTPGVVCVTHYLRNQMVGRCQYTVTEFGMKDWVDHIFTTFRHPKVEHLIFAPSCTRFDVNSIGELLKGVPIDQLELMGMEGRAREASQRALEVFHNIPLLSTVTNPYETLSFFQRILIRNYDLITVQDEIRFSLNDLLISNSLNVQCRWNVSLKTVNQFLKLWMSGAMSRIERLNALLLNVINHEDILKGITYISNSPNQTKVFKMNAPDSILLRKLHIDVVEGFDITRKDGTTATIVVNGRSFNLFVWSH